MTEITEITEIAEIPFEAECDCHSTCSTTCVQCADITLPIKLKPYACLGDVITECEGKPKVKVHSFQGASCACGCEITVTQKVCFHLPIVYGAVIEPSEVNVNCQNSID